MSAIPKALATIFVAFGTTACASPPEDLFSSDCSDGGAVRDGGCAGTSIARRDASREDGRSAADAAPSPLPKCPVSGGGASLSPPGSCTVLAYCNREEFRLVCRIGAPTCDCRTRGVIVKTIANDRDYCARDPDGGSRANVEEANGACGWNLDTSSGRL